MGDQKEEKHCIRCHHVAEEKDLFCVRCGAPLINRCSDTKTKGRHGCGHTNRPNASFCAKCGSETIFKKHGLL